MFWAILVVVLLALAFPTTAVFAGAGAIAVTRFLVKAAFVLLIAAIAGVALLGL